eukprot:jgi/Mesvir1/9654/Mv25320-RA.1
MFNVLTRLPSLQCIVTVLCWLVTASAVAPQLFLPTACAIRYRSIYLDPQSPYTIQPSIPWPTVTTAPCTSLLKYNTYALVVSLT